MKSRTLFSLLAPLIVSCWLFAGFAGFAQDKKEPDPKVEEKKDPALKAPPLKAITDKLPEVFSRKGPENVADLQAIQDHVAMLVAKVSPAVVSVRVGPSSGSGVIISPDGYVLTAGHVSGAPNRDVTIYFANGETAKGKTLGGNHGIDSGMIKITTQRQNPWPFAEMGDSASLKTGHWCMVVAHHGGFKPGRTPPVRLGRILANGVTTITTDAILVGGDSGGPLFDMHGRVIGINSRIGNALTANMHVPVNPFRDDWAKIAKGETWGKLGGIVGGVPKGGPFLGLTTDPKADGCVVLAVTGGSPAEKAGLKPGDVIRKFNQTDITDRAMLPKLVLASKTGDTVTLEIRRGNEALTVKVEIGKRP